MYIFVYVYVVYVYSIYCICIRSIYCIPICSICIRICIGSIYCIHIRICCICTRSICISKHISYCSSTSEGCTASNCFIQYKAKGIGIYGLVVWEAESVFGGLGEGGWEGQNYDHIVCIHVRYVHAKTCSMAGCNIQ